MDACINKGIIERTPGPSGVMVRDTKRVFSELWKKSPKVINCLNVLKKKEIEPEEALETFFKSGTEDQVLWCFLVLVSLNHDETLAVVHDLVDHMFDGGVDEAYEEFFSRIYTKQKVCSGRRYDYGRKKPRTAA